MGGSKKNKNKDELSIVADVPQISGEFVAGSMITGTIYAKIPGNAFGLKLDLYFTGKENVKVPYFEQEDYEEIVDGEIQTLTRSVQKKSNSKREIVRISIPVFGDEFDSEVVEGSYAYPFEFQLPDHLPSSMSFKKDDGSCKIVYKIKAKLKGDFGKLKDDETIKVLAKPPSSSHLPYSVEPITTEITTCCCFGSGDITFAAHVDDTRVGKGETANVSFACENNSSQEINSAKAELVQEIYSKSKHHSQRSKDTIASKTFNLTMGMSKLTDDEKEQKKNMDDDDADEMKLSMYRDILKTVTEGTNQVSLQVPSHVVNTYNGQLITVKHFLRIKVETGTFCTSPQAKFETSIVSPESVKEIYDSPVVPSSPPPAGWGEIKKKEKPVGDLHLKVKFGGPILVAELTGEGGKAVFPPVVIAEEDLAPPKPSLDALKKELEDLPDDKWTIEQKLMDESWTTFFRDLQPNDYAIILKAVDEFQKIDVAVLVAAAIPEFTTYYVVAGLRTVPEWVRIGLVQNLLPLCVDAKEKSDLIKNELTVWEQINLEIEFAKAKGQV